MLQFEIQSLKEDIEHQVSVTTTLKKIIGAEVLASSPIAASEVRLLGSEPIPLIFEWGICNTFHFATGCQGAKCKVSGSTQQG
jgi:hypothetical protein